MSPQLKETNGLLKRIAEALEQVVLHEYGIRLGHCAQKVDDPNPQDEPDVEYETDFTSLKAQFERVAKHKSVDDVIEDEL